MHLEELIASGFAALNSQAYGVLNVGPQGQDWYVVADRNNMQPLLETDDRQEAISKAKTLMDWNDLAMWANLMDDDRCVDIQYKGALLTHSSDGLPLVPPSMVEAAKTVTKHFGPPNSDLTSDHYDNVSQWNGLVNELGIGNVNNQSVLALVDIPEGHLGRKNDKDQVYVLLSNSYVHYLDEAPQFHVQILNPYTPKFDNDLSLSGLLHKFNSVYTKSRVIDEKEDFDDEKKYITRDCPLYMQHHNPATDEEKVFVFEGGPTMEYLAKHRPWMVVQDAQGNPLPLRIEKISSLLDTADEEGLDKQSQWLSGVVIRDAMTEYARQAVIEQQRKSGIEPEQVMDDGRQFLRVAKIRDLDLEVMFDKTGPNTLGTREWFAYRIWVSGELVMDVHPDNPEVYAARILSLSPLGGKLQGDVASISDSQCGEFLMTALSDLSTDEDSKDAFLPDRIKQFLTSSYVDEIRSDAQALENGEAELVDGVFKEQPVDANDDNSEEMTP